MGAGDTAPSLPGLTFPRGTGAKGWVPKKLHLCPRSLPAPPPPLSEGSPAGRPGFGGDSRAAPLCWLCEGGWSYAVSRWEMGGRPKDGVGFFSHLPA